MLYRNVQERVKKIAPFLTFDSDPYLVIDDGRLVWIIDAYTSTNKYPYAAKVTNSESIFYGQNYIRNSVKVTVDAYTGETNFYIVAPFWWFLCRKFRWRYSIRPLYCRIR